MEMIKGARFSECGKHRLSLWRIWDEAKPWVMFVGLNPSTANAENDDPTIKRVCRIANNNGFGGVYMMNCFTFISTDPNGLQIDFESTRINDSNLYAISEQCSEVVFAWGNFKVVTDNGRDVQLRRMFPKAKALHLNKNGSPKHPLYCKIDSKFINIKWK